MKTHIRVTIWGILAGVFFGIGGVVLKFMAEGSVDWASVICTPMMFPLILTNGIGFYLLQKALAEGKTGVVVGLNTTFSTAVPVIVGFFLMGETLSFVNWMGISLIIAGIILFSIKKG